MEKGITQRKEIRGTEHNAQGKNRGGTGGVAFKCDEEDDKPGEENQTQNHDGFDAEEEFAILTAWFLRQAHGRPPGRARFNLKCDTGIL